MAAKNPIPSFLRQVYETIILLISMAGFVPKNATLPRIAVMTISVTFALYLALFQTDNTNLAVIYYMISEVAYVGFLILTLSEKGIRNWFMQKWKDENKAYLAYETVLGTLFFHNLISLGYVASSSPGSLLRFIPEEVLLVPVAVLFISGFAVKILAAKAVSIEIYYLKDMFLGKKISTFVVSGPYKYLSNPMYGIGQLQAYATALWYNSEIGILAALINQMLIFTFYYLVERKFIQRVYLK